MTDWFAPLTEWIGRSEEIEDVAALSPLEGLAATLDHADPPWRPGEVPPLGHWLYFLPRHRQSEVGPDGHARRGGFLPPVPLPRRMWAGGRIEFHRPIAIGAAIARRSAVADVRLKQGRTGPLVFVLVRHQIFVADELALTEEHDIVYRGPTEAAAALPRGDQGEPAPWRREVTADAVMLFRYSALTFNGHRIHYDRDWCRDAEGYPGLVVHGPLTATLLVDLFLRRHPGATIDRFAFRAQRPLFDGRPITLCGRPGDGGAALWALTPEGELATTAELAAR